MSQVYIGLICAIGLLGMYLAGTAGIVAAILLMVVVVYTAGVATRGIKRAVRWTRSHIKGPSALAELRHGNRNVGVETLKRLIHRG
jgi:hypothetical protein